MVTPDIHDIIKKSIAIGKNIMFYLPRLIDINELFDLIYDVTHQEFIYLDVHILESANKIKAILLLFGPNNSPITKNEIQNFITMMTKQTLLKDSKESDHEESDYKETTVIARKQSNDSTYSNSNIEYLVSLQEDSHIIENQLIYSDSHMSFNANSANCYKNLVGNILLKDKDTYSIERTLWKIYSVIGLKKFIEAMIKFKEKYESEDLKYSMSYVPSSNKSYDLITFLLNEVLTDKQLNRIHI